PATGRIFGVVNIDTGHERAVAERCKAQPGEALQIQVGRDRLLDNKAYEQLANLIRYALHFYANRYRARLMRDEERRRVFEPSSTKQRRALDILERNRDTIPAT